MLSEHAQGKLPTISVRHIGPALIFQRLWQLTGCQHVIEQLLKGRHFEFAIERAIFLTVLHRLFDPGSDRAADKWKGSYQIEGCEDLQLHHLYRAMGWLGDDLPRKDQADKTPFAPRCIKDLIEEGLFARRRDLFTQLQLVFFDTTSIYFEGQGGETIGQRGHSKDHRPDLKQMIVGAVLDGQGRPICCELWPGNTADVTTLIPVVDRLRGRFGVTKVCIVADRGMISKETIEELEKEERGWQYILGARMRSQNEVKDEVLARAGRYRVVHPQRTTSDAPAPLKVKEVRVEGRRYIVCLNDDEARKDAADREAIVASLREKLRTGEKSLVGNKGYRRYLSSTGPDHFQIDEAKIEEEARYDGKWVLRTNTDLDTAEVALQYKRLWMVEAWFRSTQVAVADPADLSQVRRDDPWSRVLLVPGVGAASGAGGPAGQGWSRLRVGRRDPRPGPLADGGSRAGWEAVPAAERGPGHLWHGLPSGRSRRATHRAAGPAISRRPGAEILVPRRACKSVNATLQ